MTPPHGCSTIPAVKNVGIPSENIPDPWLYDTERLLRDLDYVRELILKIPLHPDTHLPTDTAVRALWKLQTDLRYLLLLRGEGQRSWQKRTTTPERKVAPTISPLLKKQA